jgi:phospholipid/cholesterol/gamma-HCH transport system substrate-binding protein
MNTHRLRYSLYGVTFIVALIGVVVLTIMQFNRAFDSSVPLRVHAPRAGLLLTDGSAVKLRGVTVGRVDSLTPTAQGADLELAMTPGEMHLIPANIGANIVPPTVFGGKYVDLIEPAHPAAQPIADGATIDASHVTVEINDTFAHLMSLLQATKPAAVNAALSGLAGALQGRGEELGHMIVTIDAYLREINPELPTLRTDAVLGRSVLNNYAGVTPKLLQLANDASTTSDSLVANKASLDAFMLSLTSVARRTTSFVQQNQHNLLTTLNVLQPTTRVLAEYAPEFPCFFRALVYPAIPLAEDAIGGRQPGLGVLAQFLPPQAAYRYPRDLPVVAADTGPHCYGLPNIPMGHQNPHKVFNTGPDPYAGDSPKGGFTVKNLLELFFGPLHGTTGLGK